MKTTTESGKEIEIVDHYDTEQKTTLNLKRVKRECEKNHVFSQGRSKRKTYQVRDERV